VINLVQGGQVVRCLDLLHAAKEVAKGENARQRDQGRIKMRGGRGGGRGGEREGQVGGRGGGRPYL
jgi:hypothetical protein